MKICMVTMHACIRVFKYTYAIKEHHPDWEVYLMADRDSMGWNIYDAYTKYLDKNMFQKQIKMYDKFVDLYHIHNEPDHLVEWVREISDKPIIYDCHDLQSLRTMDAPDMNELAAFELADHVVHVSEHIAASAVKNHGEHDHTIIKSWVNKRFFAKKPIVPAWDSVCYEGGVTDEEKIDGLFSYRYQAPWVGILSQQGYHCTVYTAHQGEFPNLEQQGAVVHKNLPYPMLMKSMQRHSMGFVGACVQVPIMMQAVPNKLFEYMSQGVVPFCHWADEAYKQIEGMGIGFKIKDIHNFREETKSVKQKRKKLLKERWNFTFENQMPQIEAMYKEVTS